MPLAVCAVEQLKYHFSALDHFRVDMHCFYFYREIQLPLAVYLIEYLK